MRNLLAIVSALILLLACASPDKVGPKEEEASEVLPAVDMVSHLGLGWNLGNQMDAYYTYGELKDIPDETCWGGELATAATFRGVKSAGFRSVRIPVTWLRKIGAAPSYTLDAERLERVAQLVEYAHAAGLTVILNIHHDECNGDGHWLDILKASTDVGANARIKLEIKAVWAQLATRFKDCGNWLIFESFNEIQDGGWGYSDAFKANPAKQCDILNQWNQMFVDAVRATGGNNASRYLGVPSYAANPGFAQYFELPTDPAGRVMLAVHFYDPSDYTIGEEQYSDWGHTGKKEQKAQEDEAHVETVFKNLYTNYVAKNIPVYIGEFGCSMRSPDDSRAWAFYCYYLEYVVKAARTYGMPCLLWDNGAEGYGQERHGYIDHGTGAYTANGQEPVEAMVKAWSTTDASYTLQSVYDSAPVF